MAACLLLFWIAIFLFVIYADGTGEFLVVYSPKSIKFTGKSKISQNSIKYIYLAALGLSVPETAERSHIHLLDPFNTPEAIVEILVEGVPSLKKFLRGKSYPLITDHMDDTYTVLSESIKERSTEYNNRLVKISLNNVKLISKAFGIANLTQKTRIYQDIFSKEIEILTEISEKVPNSEIFRDSEIDFYKFKMKGLLSIADYFGRKSFKMRNSVATLSEELQTLCNAFTKLYEGRVLFTVVTTGFYSPHRSLIALAEDIPDEEEDDEFPNEDAEEEPENQDHEIEPYDADYPVMFMLILASSAMFILAFVGVVYQIVEMDPGKDSTIYRMTDMRLSTINFPSHV